MYVLPSWCIQTDATPSESCSSKVWKLLYLLGCLPLDQHRCRPLLPATVTDAAVICLLCETWRIHACVLTTAFRKWWCRILGLAWPPVSLSSWPWCPRDLYDHRPACSGHPGVHPVLGLYAGSSPESSPLSPSHETLPRQSKQRTSLEHLLHWVIIIFLLV